MLMVQIIKMAMKVIKQNLGMVISKTPMLAAVKICLNCLNCLEMYLVLTFTWKNTKMIVLELKDWKIVPESDIGTLKIDNHLCDEILFTAPQVPEKKFQIFQLKLLFLGITILMP